jgi:hypothetical protein
MSLLVMEWTFLFMPVGVLFGGVAFPCRGHCRVRRDAQFLVQLEPQRGKALLVKLAGLIESDLVVVDHLSAVKYHYAVGQGDGFVDVVGDENDRRVVAIAQ